MSHPARRESESQPCSQWLTPPSHPFLTVASFWALSPRHTPVWSTLLTLSNYLSWSSKPQVKVSRHCLQPQAFMSCCLHESHPSQAIWQGPGEAKKPLVGMNVVTTDLLCWGLGLLYFKVIGTSSWQRRWTCNPHHSCQSCYSQQQGPNT